MIEINPEQLRSMERFYRANLVNGISGYKPVALIATKNTTAQTNLAIFSSIIHLSADPALIGFIQRPIGQSGDTYRNIIATEYYTINLVPQSIIQKAHYTSAKFSSEISEFYSCKLTEQWLDDFPVPFVEECPIKIGLQFVEEIPIKYNDTKLMIGSVEKILLPEKSLCPDGNVDLNSCAIVAVSGLENYHLPQPLASFPYAKVSNLPPFADQ
jgi:flavin reductase (DIM6/NTAB) family NADH-FMN oxidoreductase RutF